MLVAAGVVFALGKVRRKVRREEVGVHVRGLPLESHPVDQTMLQVGVDGGN